MLKSILTTLSIALTTITGIWQGSWGLTALHFTLTKVLVQPVWPLGTDTPERLQNGNRFPDLRLIPTLIQKRIHPLVS